MGKMTWVSCKVEYDGAWENEVPHGEGTIKLRGSGVIKSSQTHQGNWKNGLLMRDRICVQIWPDGKLYFGKMEEN
jgi:hypothetical protein